jgi:hypothetical protein
LSNLRQKIESDLAVSLESLDQFGLPVILISPAGDIIDESLHGGVLAGEIRYETGKVNPDTGEEMYVNNPIVTLRRTSLSRVPVHGEKWLVRIPISPVQGAPIEDFIIDATHAMAGGGSAGFIKLYLRRAVQSV